MSEEKRNAAEQIGTLGSCLIEGDPEQKARERRIKKRALGISVSLQCAALVALLFVPLLGRTEKLPLTIVTPVPPYHRVANRSVNDVRQSPPTNRRECIVCFNRDLSAHPSSQSTVRTNTPPGDGPDIDIPGTTSNHIPGMDGFDNRRGPEPPPDPNAGQKKRITIGRIEPAMILHRVEPVYPTIMRQIRRSGRVELRAIISTEGTIESLQVISGEPAFYASAIEAVKQWKYRPTYLNGQPVEVETIITVVYTLNQ